MMNEDDPKTKKSYDRRPPIASIKKRLGAWVIDIFLLGIIGQIIGWSFSSIWFQIGPTGRIVGLILMLLYFGILNSRFGEGQTVGKRWMKITVRDYRNEPISFRTALLRTVIVILPIILNGWSLPIFQSMIIQWILAILVFGWGIVLVYTMLFNQSTRQGIHDLVCRTYVVSLSGKSTTEFPKTPAKLVKTAGIIFSTVAILVSVLMVISPSFVSKIDLTEHRELYQTLETDERFFSVSVKDRRIYSSPGGEERILEIGVWYKGKPQIDERKQIINDIATLVISNFEEINAYDGMIINVTSAYDLGIATGHISFHETKSINDWQQQ